MNDKYFIDTNIFIYSFINQSPEKQRVSQEIIAIALETHSGIISWQVIQEFINVSTRKDSPKLKPVDIREYLNSVLHPLLYVYPDVAIFQKAIDIISKTNYTFYDSLIIASALYSNCNILFSEDLQHKHQIETITIINPFI